MLFCVPLLAYAAFAGYAGYRLSAAKHRLTSVHPPVNYIGDGTFSDSGEDAGIYRFAIDLGVVATDDGPLGEFRMSGLPRAHFVIFLKVDTDDVTSRYRNVHAEWESSIFYVTVKSGDQIVARAHGPLSEWTLTSGTMLYHLDAVFDASIDATYDVTAKLDSSVQNFPAHQLLLLGGGWKDQATSRLHFRTEYPGRG